MILSQALKFFYRGLQGEECYHKDPNNTVDYLKDSMSANPTTTEAFRESEVVWWVLLRILLLHQNSSSGGCRGERIINRAHHNTLISLKAYIVTGFADMPREETTLLLIIRSPCNPLDYYFLGGL